MKHVLIVIATLRVGGAEKIARDIGINADSSRYSIDYLVYGSELGEYEDEVKRKGCRVYHIPFPKKGYISFYKELKRLFKACCYDVVHCHTMFNSGLVLYAAKQSGVPIRIAHSHTIKKPERTSIPQGIYERLMRKAIIKNATRYVACGKEAGNWLFGKKAFAEEGSVILNGIELDLFGYQQTKRDEIRERLNISDRFVIGHVGHLAYVKNQQFLLNCMPDLLQKRGNVLLLLLGEGEDREKLEKMIDVQHLNERVKLLGNVENVNDYLNAMDVFAFPSLYEGTPLSVIEAQTNGLPCIISDRIPKDVYLSDLITPVKLEEKERWINALLSAERKSPHLYLEKIKACGLGKEKMLSSIYSVYNGY